MWVWVCNVLWLVCATSFFFFASDDFLSLFRPNIPANIQEVCSGGKWSLLGMLMGTGEVVAKRLEEDHGNHETGSGPFLHFALAIGAFILIAVPIAVCRARSRAAEPSPGYVFGGGVDNGDRRAGFKEEENRSLSMLLHSP